MAFSADAEGAGHMTRVYYKEAVGAFLVFDVGRERTYEAVSKWKADLDNCLSVPGNAHVQCAARTAQRACVALQ